jgi:hypothetical protein
MGSLPCIARLILAPTIDGPARCRRSVTLVDGVQTSRRALLDIPLFDI